ncbi:KRI1-like family C-terminal-domain-containing protein [Suillus subluteus]|nr:KRI1-like family C-terminal-domain-containing protein [Suillus subluteus]
MLSDSDTEDIQTLTINEHYAKAFEYKKSARSSQNVLKEKYGSDFEDSADEETDSEDAESEDEDGEELTPAMDAAILRTLARIKKKDPAIYNAENTIFEGTRSRSAPPFSKPLTFRQATLASALEANTSRSPTPEPHIPTYTEEQRQLRDETRTAFHAAAESDDDELIVPREKTKDELEDEEQEYKEYLKHVVGPDLESLIEAENGEQGADEKKKSKTKKSGNEAKGMSKQEADQEFLVSYILNRGWIDKSTKRLPTYNDIVGKAKDSATESDQGSVAIGKQGAYEHGIEDEDEFEEIADAFETSYNFRFEEPDAATIKSFPRNIASTEGRERKKRRQEEELEKKHEEVKRLKALKMKEVRRKLERIGPRLGRLTSTSTTLYLPSLPNPRRLRKRRRKRRKRKTMTTTNEGVDINTMDADVNGTGTEEMRKRKLDEYMNEVYELDFNDMVAGIPTRFKYATTAPQTFALTPTEILMATDKELNQYVSVKRYAPYRAEKWDRNRGERLTEFRENLKQRVGATRTSHRSEDPTPKKRLGKKERQKMKAAAA